CWRRCGWPGRGSTRRDMVLVSYRVAESRKLLQQIVVGLGKPGQIERDLNQLLGAEHITRRRFLTRFDRGYKLRVERRRTNAYPGSAETIGDYNRFGLAQK